MWGGGTEEVRPGLSVDEHGGTGTLRVKKKKNYIPGYISFTSTKLALNNLGGIYPE